MTMAPLRLGISRCLLGDEVRFDGGHKRDHFLSDILSCRVEWVSVCPEVEAGLGIPREPMRLVGKANAPRLMTITSTQDLTRQLKSFSTRKLDEFQRLDLSGYVLKARSPSCGVEQVPLHDERGIARSHGMGLFARSVRKRYPLIPIADEESLADPAACASFLRQVLGYHRWSMLTKSSLTHRAVVEFHRAQAELFMTGRPEQYQPLNRLVERARRYRPKELVARYGRAFMRALCQPSGAGGTHLRKRS